MVKQIAVWFTGRTRNLEGGNFRAVEEAVVVSAITSFKESLVFPLKFLSAFSISPIFFFFIFNWLWYLLYYYVLYNCKMHVLFPLMDQELAEVGDFVLYFESLTLYITMRYTQIVGLVLASDGKHPWRHQLNTC